MLVHVCNITITASNYHHKVVLVQLDQWTTHGPFDCFFLGLFNLITKLTQKQ